MGILRIRIAMVTAMGTLVAITAGEVFDQRRWELLVAPVVIGVVGLLVAARGPLLRFAGAAVGVVVGVVAATLLAEGDIADALDAFTSGPQRLLTTEWPSPARPDLIATTALGLGVLVALAAWLARQVRLHLAPLLPIVAAQTLAIALSAPGGTRMMMLIPLGTIAVGFALLRPGVGIRERWTQIQGERRAIPMTVFVFTLTGAVAVPLSIDDRADPRRTDEPERTARLIDPIEATIALQDLATPVALHRVRVEGATMPTRWRTAALDDYDGRRWEPSLDLREIGGRLAADGPDDIVGTVEFENEGQQLVPLPGAPVTVDAAIQTDPRRTLVRLSDRPEVGLTVDFRARPTPTITSLPSLVVGFRPVDENVSGLTELAETIVADAAPNNVPPPDLLTRLRLIESTMRTEFLLDREALGGGLQRGLIVRFLRGDGEDGERRGNAEQFVASFVLLARSLGVDARVATGFAIDPATVSEVDGGGLVADITSEHAEVWPEVSIGGDWLAFDPVPDTEAVDTEDENQEPPQQSPAAPQPPTPPPPESADEPTVTDVEESDESDDVLPAVVVVGLRTAAVIGSLLVPIVLVIGLILGIKWRERRRRLRGPPTERIRGAWSVATNRLIDAGMSITPASTNDEIARSGSEFAPSADREIHRLASLADAATFGTPARTDLLVDDATACLGQVETSLGASRSRWQRLRWQLSTRSLRRRTRSPV